MIDPRSLRDQALSFFELEAIEDIDEYDDDEPFVLEATELGAADIAELGGASVAFDRCVISGSDLSLVRVCGIKNSFIVDSKLRGTTFSKYLRNVVFDSCQLTECTMRMVQLEKVVFEASQLTKCDFYGSELTKLQFPKTTFSGVGFDQCTIDEVDLSDAVDLQIGDPRTLRGVILRETQVPLIALRLAELSGITIQDH